MLQLKTYQIFEELLENQQNSAQTKIDIIKVSEVCSKIVHLADTAHYTFKSERKVRNGYMGFVIKLANIIQKRVELDNLAEYAPEIFENDDWRSFCEGELDESNKTNSKSLGGHARSINNDDDLLDDAPMDINMEKIMARFNTYSQQVSQSSSSNDEDDEDLEDQNEDMDLRDT